MNSFPNIGQIILYSADPKKLASFFSHLLDIEIIESEKQLLLHHDGFSLCISSGAQQGRAVNDNSMLVCMVFADSDEVEDLFSKLQFISYRSNGQHLLEGAQIVRSENGSTFFDACDTDGRKWRFLSES